MDPADAVAAPLVFHFVLQFGRHPREERSDKKELWTCHRPINGVSIEDQIHLFRMPNPVVCIHTLLWSRLYYLLWFTSRRPQCLGFSSTPR
jgi:hypothetical protein